MNKFFVALLMLPCLVYSSAFAGERREVLSRVFAVDKSRSVEIDVQHKFYAVITEEVVFADALPDNHPFKELTGICVGWFESSPASKKGNGECVYTNPTGGKWRVTWDMGAEGGNYTVTGIEGDATGWKGAGRWRVVAGFSNDRNYQTWNGWIEAP